MFVRFSPFDFLLLKLIKSFKRPLYWFLFIWQIATHVHDVEPFGVYLLYSSTLLVLLLQIRLLLTMIFVIGIFSAWLRLPKALNLPLSAKFARKLKKISRCGALMTIIWGLGIIVVNSSLANERGLILATVLERLAVAESWVSYTNISTL